MTLGTPRIDSESVGNPLRYRRLEELEEGLDALPRGPWDRGRVELIVARTAGGRRERPDRVRLEADAGIPGDAWGRQQGPHPERAITVMEFDVAELIANGQPLALFGDNLYLTLDLSTDNLPAGSRVRAGGAVLEVTAMPHNESSERDSVRTLCSSYRRPSYAIGTFAASTCARWKAARSPRAIPPRSSPGPCCLHRTRSRSPEPVGRVRSPTVLLGLSDD